MIHQIDRDTAAEIVASLRAQASASWDDLLPWLSHVIARVRQKSGPQAGRILALQRLQRVVERQRRALKRGAEEREVLKQWLLQSYRTNGVAQPELTRLDIDQALRNRLAEVSRTGRM